MLPQEYGIGLWETLHDAVLTLREEGSELTLCFERPCESDSPLDKIRIVIFDPIVTLAEWNQEQMVPTESWTEVGDVKEAGYYPKTRVMVSLLELDAGKAETGRFLHVRVDGSRIAFCKNDEEVTPTEFQELGAKFWD